MIRDGGLMQPEFRDRLPANVLALVDKIEAGAGQEIRVQRGGYPVPADDAYPDAMAASVTEHAATVFFRSPEAFSVDGAVHELLHIERYWLERVPQILPVAAAFDADRVSITSSIENCLEHMVIVPQEANYDVERLAYWNKALAGIWGRHPWPDLTEPWARRKNCLLGWLATAHMGSDEAVKTLAATALQAEGQWVEAQKFAAKVSSQMAANDKAAALATVVRFLKIPIDQVELVTLYPRTKQRKVEKVAAH
jgi:hypothetical protein